MHPGNPIQDWFAEDTKNNRHYQTLPKFNLDKGFIEYYLIQDGAKLEII
jgi:hypothetical protein